jgi:hypothetical protein
MSEQRWIVRVHDKEYGPVDFKILVEWKNEGRVIPENPVRAIDCESWTRAAEIPGLFELNRPPIQASPPSISSNSQSAIGDPQLADTMPAVLPDNDAGAASATTRSRSFFGILAETFRVFGRSFVQFIALAIFAIFPSVCAQLASEWIQSSPGSMDVRTLVAGAFAFCMFVLSIVLWPIYVAGIQIISAETHAGRRIGFFPALNEAVKFWPRAAALCVFVYGIFFLLTLFAIAIALMIITGAQSPVLIFLALGLLVLQVWMFGRFFINVMFWQQFAVLENTGVFESLRQSKMLARSGRNLPWYQRPWWRGAVIVSIWMAVVLGIALYSDWPRLIEEWNAIQTIRDPQLLVQKITEIEQARGFNVLAFSLAILQKFLQPVLGIAFVVLYFDSKSRSDETDFPSD